MRLGKVVAVGTVENQHVNRRAADGDWRKLWSGNKDDKNTKEERDEEDWQVFG
jgi:hypothetical protein